MNTNPLNAYKETRIRTAGQGQLIVMLYDEAIKQIDLAIHALETKSKKLDEVHNAIVKAQDIVTELTASLDFEKGGDIAKNLFGLYMFFNNQLMEGNVGKNPKLLKTIRGLMNELRSAWAEIAAKSPDVRGPSAGLNIAG